MRGFVNILKPKNMTSSDVVVKVRGILRRITGERHKVGHLGTLDPLGTGVLPIAIGKATKLFDLLSNKEKTYVATFKFSITTDTLDSGGVVTESGKRVPSKEEIQSVLHKFEGEISQLPPLYSAKSVNGKRAYEYARKGEFIELTPKNIRIYSIKIVCGEGEEFCANGSVRNLENGEFAFEIVCGGGTYIRSLARDIALELDTVAYMTSIHRTKSGSFVENTAVGLDDFQLDPLKYFQPIEFALADYKNFELPCDSADKILNGVKTELSGMPDEEVFAVTKDSEIVGTAINDGGYLKFIVRL